MNRDGSLVPVAIAHDYLTQRGGAERVVQALLLAFPGAPVYTSLYDASGTFPEFRGADVRPSPLNRIPFLRQRYRLAFPLLAPTFSRLRVAARVTLCSSSGWAHGVAASGRKIVYCYNPARWLYQADQYLGGERTLQGLGLRALAPYLQRWDLSKAASAHRYIAISRVVRDRIASRYGIDAEVINPPIGITPDGSLEPVPEVDPGFFLCVSRLLPYKNVDQVMEAFAMLPRDRLVVAGTGPQESLLSRRQSANVRMVGRVGDRQLRWLYNNCAGVVAASYEDFGLVPVEAAAFGKPSAVLAWGGFLDTVRPGITGVTFATPRASAIVDGIRQLQARRWDAGSLQRHAANYSLSTFVNRMRGIVAEEENLFRHVEGAGLDHVVSS